MGIEELREMMPRFVTGGLPEKEMLRVSQALADSPEAMEELRFTLRLRQAVQAQEAPLPAFPRLSRQESPSLLPPPLDRSLGLLQRAWGITRGAVQTALNML